MFDRLLRSESSIGTRALPTHRLHTSAAVDRLILPEINIAFANYWRMIFLLPAMLEFDQSPPRIWRAVL